MLQSTTSRVIRHGPITRLSMVMKVAGVPLHPVSVYRIGNTLVESGAPSTTEVVLGFMRMHPVNKVVVTHHHEDHAGGGAGIIARLGIPVLVPEGAIPILEDGPRIPIYRRVVSTVPDTYTAEPLPDVVDAGDHSLWVVPTPGHAFDHVCFFEPEKRWLFTGDLFVSEKFPILRRIEHVHEHIASLERVLALEPDLLLCSHAGAVQDATGALKRKIDYWKRLEERARDLRGRGWSVDRITREILGPEGPLTYLSFGEYSKRRLIEDLLGPS